MRGITLAHVKDLIKWMRKDVDTGHDEQGTIYLDAFLDDKELPDHDCSAIFDVRSAHHAALTQAQAICELHNTTLHEVANENRI